MPGPEEFASVRLTRPPTLTPSDAALDEAEAEIGVSLPPSYREFAKRFGYGILFRLYIIYIPMEGEDSLTERNAVLRNVLEIGVTEKIVDYKPHGSPELLLRLVPFGVSESGDILGWDPAERSGQELAIYLIGPRNAGVTRSASDLYDFVNKCLTHSERGSLPRRTGSVEPIFEPKEPR
jgi:hypothetical protein